MASLAPSRVERIAREYDRAWNAKDVETIVAMHSEDGTYRLHLAGAPTLTGRQALATAFRSSLDNWSELSFELDHVACGTGFYVWQARLRGVLARPLDMGAITIPANGASLEFTGVDAITLDADGLIVSKESYFDILAAANQAQRPDRTVNR
jgi:hypothetical protein